MIAAQWLLHNGARLQGRSGMIRELKLVQLLAMQLLWGTVMMALRLLLPLGGVGVHFWETHGTERREQRMRLVPVWLNVGGHAF